MSFYTQDTTYPSSVSGGNGDAVFYESFDNCAGKGGNDDMWNSISGNPVLVPDNEGWTGSKMFSGNKCGHFGTGKVVGEVTSPSFYLDGPGVLSFKAAAWNSNTDGKTLDVHITGTSTAVFSGEIGKGSWAEISIPVTGNGDSKLTFTPDKRFFLDEVTVKADSSTGINDVADFGTKLMDVYTIAGQKVNSVDGKLPAGMYIINGKKVLVK